jgi:hypothetical protein
MRLLWEVVVETLGGIKRSIQLIWAGIRGG